jgi:hypothetical protein
VSIFQYIFKQYLLNGNADVILFAKIIFIVIDGCLEEGKAVGE